jgi:hypothetical protein
VYSVSGCAHETARNKGEAPDKVEETRDRIDAIDEIGTVKLAARVDTGYAGVVRSGWWWWGAVGGG